MKYILTELALDFLKHQPDKTVAEEQMRLASVDFAEALKQANAEMNVNRLQQIEKQMLEVATSQVQNVEIYNEMIRGNKTIRRLMMSSIVAFVVATLLKMFLIYG